MKKLLLLLMLGSLHSLSAMEMVTEDNSLLSKQLFSVIKQNGSSEEILSLIKKGADVNVKGGCGTTPLIEATLNNHSDIAQILIDNGAEVNVQLELLEHTPLLIATLHGLIKISLSLIEKGADVNCKETLKNTPLLFATFAGQEEVCKALIEKGAAVNVVNSFGGTPLMYAAQNGMLETCNLLLKKGANINAIDNNHGLTPLRYAISNGHFKICQLLIDNGADVNKSDTNKATPLMAAACNNQVEMCTYLLNHGAKGHSIDSFNQTSLSWAAKKGNAKICQQLLIYALILSNLKNLKESKEVIKNFMLWAKRAGLHKDITWKILKEELNECLLPVLIKGITEGKKPRSALIHWAASEIAKNTPEPFKKLMLVAQKEAKDNEIRNLLEPSLLYEIIMTLLKPFGT